MDTHTAPCVGARCTLCPPNPERREALHLLDVAVTREGPWHVAQVFLDGEALRDGASTPGHSHLLKDHCPPLLIPARSRRRALGQAERLVTRLVRAARREERRIHVAETIREQHETVRIGLRELSGGPVR